MNLIEEFNAYRAKMNDKILGEDNKVIKRFFNLDTNTYASGELDVKTKEMIGLACSMVLRCDDCIKYHLGKSYDAGLKKEEIFEVFFHRTSDRWIDCDPSLEKGRRILGRTY